jgi:hypothetical protein
VELLGSEDREDRALGHGAPAKWPIARYAIGSLKAALKARNGEVEHKRLQSTRAAWSGHRGGYGRLTCERRKSMEGAAGGIQHARPTSETD